MTATVQKRYTLDEYLEMEYHSEQRHYFYKGMVAPMGYASDNHELIVANLIGELHPLTKGTSFRIYPSNRMLFVPHCQLNYYPDAMVVKGEPQFHQHSPKMQATLNPYSLFEILSESTEDRDKFDKWRCYREIPSLRQYFMISQTEVYIDIYNRIGDSDKWENSYVNQPEQTLRIAEFDVPVADIYMLVKFPEKKQPENPQL